MKLAPSISRRVWWAYAWAFAFILGLWLLDFPRPMVDDLYYCGAGLNMAAGGDFSNPFLGRVYYPSHFFFAYPPLHSYAVFAWVKMMGVSAASMTGFAGVMYLITGWAMISLLRRYNSPQWLEWFVPVGVATALLPAGLRPEPFSVALIMLGLWLFECAPKKGAILFLAFLLAFLGGSAAPRMAPFAAMLLLFEGARLLRDPELISRRPIICGAFGAALVAAVVVFLVLIQFRIAEFWETFHYNTVKLVGGSKVELLKYYWRSFMMLAWGWPVFLMATILFVLALRPRIGEASRIAICIVCGFFAAAVIGGLTFGASWWIIFVLFLSSVDLVRRTPRNGRWSAGLAGLMLFTFLLANNRALIEVGGIFSGNIQTAEQGQRNAALALRPTPEHAILVDQFTVRYVYGYRTPPGTIDWGTATLFPGRYFDTRLWKHGDIFVLSPPNLQLLCHHTLLDAPLPLKWSPPGRPAATVYKNPREAFVVEVERCKTVRPEFLSPGSLPLKWSPDPKGP